MTPIVLVALLLQKEKSLVRNPVSNFPNRNGPTSTTKIVQLPQLEWSNFRNRVIYRLMFRRFAGGHIWQWRARRFNVASTFPRVADGFADSGICSLLVPFRLKVQNGGQDCNGRKAVGESGLHAGPGSQCYAVGLG